MTASIPDDKLRESGNVLRFVLFGAFNTALTYAIFCLLLLWLSPQPAYALTYVLGIAIAYIGNSLWVFRRQLRVETALVYPTLYIAQYLLNAGLMALFIGRLQWDPRVALALALAVVTPLSFVANRWLLRRRPTAKTAPTTADRRFQGGAAIALLLIAAAYAPGFAGFWQGDDLANLHGAYLWHTQHRFWSTLGEYFVRGISPEGTFYRPLSIASLALNYWVAGANYGAWYLVNFVVHLGNALLIMQIGRRLAADCGRDATWAAPLVGLWFGLCPMLAEGVYWVSARADGWVTLLSLLGLWCWLSAPRRAIGLPLCLLLALGFKESAAVVPLQLLLLYAGLPAARRPAARVVLPLCFALAAGLLLLRAQLFGSAWASHAAAAGQANVLDIALHAARSAVPWWQGMNAKQPDAAWLYLFALAVTAFAAVAEVGRDNARLVVSLLCAAGGMALATLLNLGELLPSGEGGRLSYNPLAWLALALCVAIASPRSRLTGASAAPGAGVWLLLAASLIGSAPLLAQLHRAWKVQRQLHALTLAVPAWVDAHPGATLMIVPQNFGAVVAARNAQGGLVLPPIQNTGLLDRALPTLSAELATREQQIAAGLLTRLTQLNPQVWDDSVAQAVLQPAAARWPEHYACWSLTERGFVELPAPDADAPSWHEALAVSLGRERRCAGLD